MNKKLVAVYAFTVLVSRIGGGFFFFINTWLITELTGVVSSAGISLLVSMIPSLLLSPLIGIWLDRISPARVAFTADICRGSLLVMYAIAHYLGNVGPISAFCVSFLVALASEIQYLSWRATLAKYGSSAQITNLNAISSVVLQTGLVLGAAVVGILFNRIGGVLVITIAALMYFLSAWGAAILVKGLDGNANTTMPTESAKRRSFFSEFSEALGYLRKNKRIAFFYALTLPNVAVLYSVNGMLTGFVKDELHLDSRAFGFIDAGYAAGAILGGILVAWLKKRADNKNFSAAYLGLLGISVVSFGNSSSLVLSIICYVAIGWCSQSSIIFSSNAQKITKNEFQGRAYSSFNSIYGLLGAIVYLTSSIVTEHRLTREFFMIEGILIILIAVWLLVSSRAKTAWGTLTEYESTSSVQVRSN